MKQQRIWPTIGVAVAILFLTANVLLVAINWAPGMQVLGNDSGFFAYAGRQLLAGKTLYVDIFDTKTPGIYYLNAAALGLFGDTQWSIWLLGVLWALGSSIALYLILKRQVRGGAALFASLFLIHTLFYPAYYQSGNLTEVYALLPQILTLGAAAMYFRTRSWRCLLGIGLLTSLAVLFKPTYFGIGFASALAVFISDVRMNAWRSLLRHALIVLTGLVFPLALVAVLAWAGDSLSELWYQVVLYDIAYAQHGFSLRNIYGTLRVLFLVPPLAYASALSAGALGYAVLELWLAIATPSVEVGATDERRHDQAPKDGSWPGLTGVIVLSILFDWALVFVSGRFFGHYFITPLPAMAAGLAYLFDKVPDIIKGIRQRVAAMSALFLIIVILSGMWGVEVAVKNVPARNAMQAFAQNFWTSVEDQVPVVNYIRRETRPEDRIFIWDDHAEIYFLSGRNSPTRFGYASQLLLPGDRTVAWFDELLQNLDRYRPALILTQADSGVGIPFLGDPAESICDRCAPMVKEQVLRLKAFVEMHYGIVDEVGSWTIYRLRP